MILLKVLIKDEKGQSLAEYSLIIAVIAMGAVISVRNFGGVLKNLWTDINNQLEAIL